MPIDSIQTPLSLTSALATPAKEGSSKIANAAQQFEALMINELMKSAKGGGDDGWLSSGSETGEETSMDMAQTQFAQAMASHGGLGLAKMIESAMTKTPTVTPPGAGAISKKME